MPMDLIFKERTIICLIILIIQFAFLKSLGIYSELITKLQ